ncbi:MAG: hypothetical protein ACKO3G_05550 [Planctomycetaceae bacterium]
MQPSQRVITAIPTRELWDEHGPVDATRSRDLSADDIRELLRRGPLRFVVADIGTGPRWLPVESSFAFWKAEVQSHLSPLGAPASLDNFSGGYCYFASEWSPAAGPPIVLLEKAH